MYVAPTILSYAYTFTQYTHNIFILFIYYFIIKSVAFRSTCCTFTGTKYYTVHCAYCALYSNIFYNIIT